MSDVKTLKEAIPEYIKYLEEQGKKKSTLYTVNLDLNYLLQELGEKKELHNILTVHIAKFFKSDIVNISGKGKPRSIHTINQIKRITRQFLVWCKKQEHIEVLPLTKEESRFLNGNKKKTKQAKEEKAKVTEKKPDKSTEKKSIIISTDSSSEQSTEQETIQKPAEPVNEIFTNNQG